jgi:hypothetical protein
MSSELQRNLAEIDQCSKMLDAAVEELAVLDMETVYAKSDNEVAYSRTFLSLEGAVELRKQQSLLDTAQERLDYDIAESKLRACKSRIQKLHAQLSMLQTVNAALRAQFQSEPFGQYT